jgi:RNA polymerase sigma-70 factor (ECF subfamily)
MDTMQAAIVLGVDEAVVKTRLHRARALLRADIEQSIGGQLDSTFAFGAQRCDRLVAAVLALLPPQPPTTTS